MIASKERREEAIHVVVETVVVDGAADVENQTTTTTDAEVVVVKLRTAKVVDEEGAVTGQKMEVGSVVAIKAIDAVAMNSTRKEMKTTTASLDLEDELDVAEVTPEEVVEVDESPLWVDEDEAEDRAFTKEEVEGTTMKIAIENDNEWKKGETTATTRIIMKATMSGTCKKTTTMTKTMTVTTNTDMEVVDSPGVVTVALGFVEDTVDGEVASIADTMPLVVAPFSNTPVKGTRQRTTRVELKEKDQVATVTLQKPPLSIRRPLLLRPFEEEEGTEVATEAEEDVAAGRVVRM